MAFCPFATTRLLAPPGTPRPTINPTQIVVHTMGSTPAAADRRFRRADAHGHAIGQSHFGIGRDGTIVQWIDTTARADATYRANRRADTTGAVAVTTEGHAWQPWTDAQTDALVRLHVWLLRTHPTIGRRVCRSAADPGLGHHTLFGAWTARTHSCPGRLRAPQWNETVIPRVLAAFGTRYGDPTPDQLAAAFVTQMTGEGEDAPPEKPPLPALPRADEPAALPAAGPPPAPPAPGGPAVRGPDPEPPHTPSVQVVVHAVRDFFLPDSAPKRDHP
ncbi:N-acetylmuramoyl-L-alanine amidase [Streptomyces sp. HPF1205]|uniref:peptidoglycan recognition protein family protein n=1 Tax=Streptomyces sp. HPF1205 TaxID=2873262 RepID=UPI001CEE01C5|nr:N-acetylmuramoyl-L-alanine amidase [Streptomyces sp. HPF1205]